MTHYEKLSEEYDKIYTFVTSTYNENGHELIERISMLNIYLARSGKLLAQAEYLQNSKTEFILSSSGVKDFSPSIQKEFIKGACKNESYLFTCLSRLNSCIMHQIESIRSQLSYLKSEMENLQ